MADFDPGLVLTFGVAGSAAALLLLVKAAGRLQGRRRVAPATIRPRQGPDHGS